VSGVQSAAPIVPALVLSAVTAAAPLLAGQGMEGCRALRERRSELQRRAMEAEIALVRGIRLRLCPDLVRASDAGAGDDFDYGAWRDCRRQAERNLARSRGVLRRDGRGVPHYSEAGARLSEQADTLAGPIAGACDPPSGGDGRP
jgi:hypothetical protein